MHLLTQALAGSLGRPIHWTRVHAVRFRKPILPDSPCEITASYPNTEGEIRFQIQGEEGLMAEGRFTIAYSDQNEESGDA